MNRPDWDQYFMQFAEDAAARSTCLSRKVGAVLVRDNHVLATGYNGVPAGIKHCEEVGCLRKKMQVESGTRHELCRGLHAEQNAIIQAACYGINIQGAVLYCTNQPCVICTKMLINAKVEKIFYAGEYADKLAKSMLVEANIPTIRWR